MTAVVRRRAAAVLALLLSAALAGCAGDDGRGGAHARLPAGTPVVLVSIDTLRSDRLPAYGYRGVETPALDRLRADAILFEHAYAPSPLTLPSHTTMLTGEIPPVHGVRENMGYELAPGELPTLPEVLRREGYRTGAAVSSLVLRATTGLDRGFELYEDEMVATSWAMASAQRPGRETLARALDWLGTVEEEPFFLFFHIYEPHHPWTPPEPFASRYGDTYDGEVANADAVIGELLDALRERGLYDDALVILTSDHGEGLGEHGELEHGPFVYREVLQVPLLLKLPGGELGGASVGRPAHLMDLAPTVLGLLGLEAGRELPGTSLLALRDAGSGTEPRPLYAETYFPRLHFGWSHLLSLIEYPHHLIQGPDPELYDLEEDPGETRNLVREERRTYARLRDRLAAIDQGFEGPGATDPEIRERLAALGYVGSVGRTASGPLPDPKSKIHVLDRLRSAYSLYRDEDYPRAVAAFRQVLAEEPALTDAWEALGNSLSRLGRLEEAHTAYRQLFEHSGGTPQAAMALAGLELRLGRLDEAEAHARLAARTFPMAHDLLAQIALRRGRLDEAREHLERAAEENPDHPGPTITGAELALQGGDPERALELTRRAEALSPEGIDPTILRGLWTLRGRALADLGRADEAVAAFEREIERFPEELGAYSHLALVHALTGDAAATRRTLQRMVEVNPHPAAYAEAARTLRVLGDEGSARRLLDHARGRWPEAPELAPPGGR